MFGFIKRKKRRAFIEERLKVLHGVYDYWKTLIVFSKELLMEKANCKDTEGFDNIIIAESKAMNEMFKVEKEVKRLEKELSTLQ